MKKHHIIHLIAILVIVGLTFYQQTQINTLKKEKNALQEQISELIMGTEAQTESTKNEVLENETAEATSIPNETASSESTATDAPLFAEDESGYHGKVTITGYATTWEREEGFCTEDCEIYTYIFFNILETDNQGIHDFIEQNTGNSFVGKNSVGLGCLKNGIITYFNASDEFGDTNTALSLELSSKIMESTKENPIDIELVRYPLELGSGAPTCYSHFTKVNPVD